MNLLQQWRQQSRIVEVWARTQGELDAREDECWRMFGVDVAYVMDERIVLTGAQVQGMDSTMGAL